MSPQSEYARPLGSQSRKGQSEPLELDESQMHAYAQTELSHWQSQFGSGVNGKGRHTPLLEESSSELLDDSLPELLEESSPELLEETIGSGKLELELAHWSHCSAPRNGP